MPHTQSRYQQDLGFTDGKMRISVPFINFTGATLAVTRIAAGQWSVRLGTPAAQANTFAVNVTQSVLRRSGFGEDLQEQFGGTGIPGSAQPQVYRPDVIPAMATAQQLQPRTALKIKGFKLLSFDCIYAIGVANATAHTCRVDQTLFVNNVAPATTAVLASGANGLATTFNATGPYVTNISLAAAQQIYRTSADGDLWIEEVITGAATTTLDFYGFDLYVEFNYN
jgi:hypothetical protein